MGCRMTHDPLELLSPKVLAALLSVTEGALSMWRHNGLGPAWIKFGPHKCSKVRYRRSDVEAWLNSHGTGHGSPQPVVGLSPATQQPVGTDSGGAVPSPRLHRSQEDVA